jgi:hypothetical protein
MDVTDCRESKELRNRGVRTEGIGIYWMGYVMVEKGSIFRR